MPKTFVFFFVFFCWYLEILLLSGHFRCKLTVSNNRRRWYRKREGTGRERKGQA